MQFQIKDYNGTSAEPKAGETLFYIQSHGKNAGKPLTKAIPNCWEVRTGRSVDFEILYIVFLSRILENFFRGSVIPFISLGDYKNIITPILKKGVHEDETINKKYIGIRNIESLISEKKIIIGKLEELKTTVCKEAIKKILQ